MTDTKRIHVTSEIGPLKRVLVHSPDGGIGKVIPTKAQEWLYEDIVDIEKMQEEYDFFKKTLLAYLDPEKLRAWFALEQKAKADGRRPRAAVPGDPEFIDSDCVIEAQQILGYLLADEEVRTRLVCSICAIERCSHDTEEMLLDPERFSPHELAKVLITGDIGKDGSDERKESKFIFPPIPNFIFTRDIGITIGDRILLSKTANPARLRESVISKYLAYYYLLKDDPDRVIEVADDEELFLVDDHQWDNKVVTVEGGDVMMVHHDHLIIGCSERTSPNAIKKVIGRLFEEDGLGITKVSVIVIPKQRSTMHIDTVFTQVSRDTWVLYAPWSRRGSSIKQKSGADVLFPEKDRPQAKILKFYQFKKRGDGSSDYDVDESLEYLEDLLAQVSCDDFGVRPSDVRFIYSGDARFPYSEREQWTDACNLVAIREGIAVGYDRNYVTIDCFKREGFAIVHAVDLIGQLKERYTKKADFSIEQALAELVPARTIILLPCGEMSRARGGSHCMTMPLLRGPFK